MLPCILGGGGVQLSTQSSHAKYLFFGQGKRQRSTFKRIAQCIEGIELLFFHRRDIARMR